MNDLELYDNEYLHVKLNNAWPLLFIFSFPDININLIEPIDYLMKDFDYYFLIYSNLKFAYLGVKHEINKINTEYHKAINKLKPEDRTSGFNLLDFINMNGVLRHEFSLESIGNTKLKLLILNKNKQMKDRFIRLDQYDYFTLEIYYNKFEIRSRMLNDKIKITSQEALHLAIYLRYASVY